MSSSKFVEILDTDDAPYSHKNISLEDVLNETRDRSASASSNSSGHSSRSPKRTATTTTTDHVAAVKTRLRGFSLKKSKT